MDAFPWVRRTDVCRALSVFGRESQLRMVQEEAGELTAAIGHFLRNPCEETLKELQEEGSDMYIVLAQLWVLIEMYSGKKPTDMPMAAPFMQKVRKWTNEMDEAEVKLCKEGSACRLL